MTLPSLASIQTAAEFVHRVMSPTPQIRWPLLCARVGAETWVKHCNGSRSFPPRFSLCFPASWSSYWRAMWRRSVSAEQ
jgi:hypothetical protein